VELLDALADTLQARSLPPDAADAITVALASLTVQVERLERQVGEVLNALPE
jgi:Holliday junction resolvasome RuvABC endonuclease subunit